MTTKDDKRTPRDIARDFVKDVVDNNSAGRAKEIRQETFKEFEDKL